MHLSIFERITKLPLVLHLIFAASTIAVFQWVKSKLDASYAASKHPVDYATGQTSFDGAQIKQYYTHMVDLGTLDIYWTTQFIDFGFILAIASMGLFFCTFISRLGRINSLARKIGLYSSLAVIFGAICDAIENLWSFIMLLNPQDFANWLAIPYSTSAVMKFGLITLAMALLLITILLALTGRILNKPKIG